MKKPSRQKTLTKTPMATLANFFERFERHPADPGYVDLYRGHPDDAYELEPALFRNRKNRKDEKNILRELISLHPGEFRDDASMFDRLVRMQHHSLPTRLLDLTFNPLVALFFACNKNKEKPGEFIRIRVRKLQVRYFDSDTVSCIANLANLTGKERDFLRHYDSEDDFIGNFNESDAGKRLLQFIRAEKPYFLSEIALGDLSKIVVVKPKQSNRRILAQQGAFLLFGLKTKLTENNTDDIKIVRTTIPAESKSTILRQLDRVNINQSSLFPEIEKAALYIMEQLTPVQGDETT